MARVSLKNIQEYDVVQLANGGSFARKDASYVHAVVYNILRAPQEGDRAISLQLLEIVPKDDVPKGTKYVVIPPSDRGKYGLNVAKTWAALMEPVSIPLTASVKQLERTGQLVPTDVTLIEQGADKAGLDQQLLSSGAGGPRNRESFNYRTIASPNRSDTQSSLGSGARATKGRGRSQSSEPAPTFEGMVVDLPLALAAQALDLDPRIVAALTTPQTAGVKPVTYLRDAWQIAQKSPEALERYFPKSNSVPPLMRMTIKEAIDAGLLENTQSLEFVTDPLGEAPALTTFRELYDLVESGQQGFSGYMGLKSKDSKHRAIIVDTVNAACRHALDTTAAPSVSIETATTALQAAQSKLMEDYLAVLSNAIHTQRYDGVPAHYMDGDRPAIVMRAISPAPKRGRPRLKP